MEKRHKMKKAAGLLFLAAVLLLGTAANPGQAFAAGKKKVTSVTFHYSAYVLKKGKSVTLKAAVLPKSALNRSLTWKSSKPGVAKVSKKGKVTAVKTGTAKITATAKDTKKKAVCKVKVVSRLTRIKSLRFQNAKKKMEAGDVQKLRVKRKPENPSLSTLYWKSSNQKIATVTQKGSIKALSPGKTVISAAAQDGSKKKCSFTLRVTEKVTEDPPQPGPAPQPVPDPRPVVYVDSLSLSKSSIDLFPGQSRQLSCSAEPKQAADQSVTWHSSNEAVARVSDGVITAKETGTAVITAVAADRGQVVSNPCRVTVKPKKTDAWDSQASVGKGYFVYQMDRNALRFEAHHQDSGKSVGIEASELAGEISGYSFITATEASPVRAFVKILQKAKDSKLLSVFGNIQIGKVTYDAAKQQITIQVTRDKKDRMLLLSGLTQTGAEQDAMAGNSRGVRFLLTAQGSSRELYMRVDLFANGSLKLFVSDADDIGRYSAPLYFWIVDNANYRYTLRVNETLNKEGCARSKLLPDFSKIKIYNIYSD